MFKIQVEGLGTDEKGFWGIRLWGRVIRQYMEKKRIENYLIDDASDGVCDLIVRSHFLTIRKEINTGKRKVPYITFSAEKIAAQPRVTHPPLFQIVANEQHGSYYPNSPIIFVPYFFDVRVLPSLTDRTTIPKTKFCCYIPTNRCSALPPSLEGGKKLMELGVDIGAGGAQAVSWSEAHKVMLPYLFTIIIENDLTSEYISEKILQPYIAESIPIYVGKNSPLDKKGELTLRGLFNPKSLILSSIEDLPAVIMSLRGSLNGENIDMFKRAAIFNPMREDICGILSLLLGKKRGEKNILDFAGIL